MVIGVIEDNGTLHCSSHDRRNFEPVGDMYLKVMEDFGSSVLQ